jgi:hypothetical protein
MWYVLWCLQETKYRDAIRYYQPLVAANASNLLGVTAIVLANLCVSYIMTSQVSAALWTYATKHHASPWLS